MHEIKIGPYQIGPRHPPFIVAEMSGNHHHSLERALELVRIAKQAGVHALKLQTYTPDTITLNSREKEFLIEDNDSLWKGKYLYDLYQEAHLPWDWHKPIFDLCQELNLVVFSTPFDESAVDFLETLHVPCYKIASLEIIDLPLIRKAAQTGKPLIISTGASHLSEIAEAVEAAKQAGCRDLILLQCTSSYPASPKDSNLKTIPQLMQTFNTLVGLSDHTLGIGVPIASIALGGCLIEKHFTLSRENLGVDAPFSLEPHELKALVIESERAWQALGQVCFVPSPSESYSLSLRPSLYFVEDLPIGTLIEARHVKSVRPGNGLSPKNIEAIIGLELRQPVRYGMPVSWNVFKD